MGWTLGRYFFFRYVTITIWFFIGLLALVFLIDFTELSGRTTGLPGFTYGSAFAISALRMPMIMLQTVPFVGLFSAMATLVSSHATPMRGWFAALISPRGATR